MQIAAALMYEHGVTGTSTEDIRVAAGVSNSQLYHYFADKDDLTRAVIAHQIEHVLTVQQSLLSQLDSFTALEAWRDLLVDFRRQRHGHGGCPIGSLASELADVDEDARVALVAGFAQWESAIRNGLAAMRERGELRDDADPGWLSLATLAALQGDCCSARPAATSLLCRPVGRRHRLHPHLRLTGFTDCAAAHPGSSHKVKVRL